MTNKEAKEKIFYQWQDFLEHNLDYAGISDAYKMALKALEQADVLQEIRQEIEKSVDSYYEGQFRNGLCKALNIIDTKIKELSE